MGNGGFAIAAMKRKVAKLEAELSLVNEKLVAAVTAQIVLADAVKAYIHQYNLLHEEDCPEDDTCTCELVQTIERALRGT